MVVIKDFSKHSSYLGNHNAGSRNLFHKSYILNESTWSTEVIIFDCLIWTVRVKSSVLILIVP